MHNDDKLVGREFVLEFVVVQKNPLASIEDNLNAIHLMQDQMVGISATSESSPI
jgi:hypothetical protein